MSRPEDEAPEGRPGRRLGLVSLLVHDYDAALAFFVGKLGFTLAADEPSVSDTAPGRAKRWVVVTPGRGGPALLLARAETEAQRARVGDQAAGRVFLFLETDDFERDFAAFTTAGVEFVRPPKTESYGTVAVFRDLCGNLWDLIGPAAPRG